MVNFMDLNQFKGYDSSTTEASLTKLDVYQRAIVSLSFMKFCSVITKLWLIL